MQTRHTRELIVPSVPFEMESTRSERPITVHSNPSLRNFLNVAFETVPSANGDIPVSSHYSGANIENVDIGGNCHKYHFCRDKSMLAATKLCLSRQKYKPFAATEICLSRQAHVCREKDVFCRDKHVFVATKMILVAAPTNDTIETKLRWCGVVLPHPLSVQTITANEISPQPLCVWGEGRRGCGGRGVKPGPNIVATRVFPQSRVCPECQ